METSKQCLVFSTQSDQHSSASIIDLLTGTTLGDFKDGHVVGQNTLRLLSSCYLVAGEKDRPRLNVWHLNRRRAFHKRIVTPGPIEALVISPCSSLLFAAIGTRLYIWQLASGDLLHTLDRHYQPVVQLACSIDGQYLLSGSDDGQVLMWSVGRLFANFSRHVLHGENEGRHEPSFTWTDHQARITGLYCGRYAPQGRCVTASLDKTCKIYNVMDGTQLISIVFDTPICSLALDISELNLFAGCENGKIYQTKLYKESAELITRIASAESTFSGHTDKVTCLSVSIDGNCLISGSADCCIKKWHIFSKNCMITYPQKAPIMNCFIVNTPTGLISADAVGTSDHFALLKREIIAGYDSNAYDDGSIIVRLPRADAKYRNFSLHTSTVANNSSGGVGGTAAAPILTDNLSTFDDADNPARLKKELEQQKKINQQLYSYNLSKILEL